MGRTKKYNTPYSGDAARMEAAFQKYLSCVAECFGKSYDDRAYDGKSISTQHEKKCDTASLRSVCEEFSISIPKARKLLITAGVYSTAQSRRVAELSDEGKSVAEIMAATGLSQASVSSYLPYQKFSYNMAETSRHAADSRRYRERKKAVEVLHDKIMKGEEADAALWRTVVAYQSYLFHTSSGLPFSYTVKCKKNGEYSGELLVSRKEESKTLTRSSVMLAFHTVLEEIVFDDVMDEDSNISTVIVPEEYKGPKAIGQIFGISYVYSLFWKWGLIKVPNKVENKLRGKQK